MRGLWGALNKKAIKMRKKDKIIEDILIFTIYFFITITISTLFLAFMGLCEKEHIKFAVEFSVISSVVLGSFEIWGENCKLLKNNVLCG